MKSPPVNITSAAANTNSPVDGPGRARIGPTASSIAAHTPKARSTSPTSTTPARAVTVGSAPPSSTRPHFAILFTSQVPFTTAIGMVSQPRLSAVNRHLVANRTYVRPNTSRF